MVWCSFSEDISVLSSDGSVVKKNGKGQRKTMQIPLLEEDELLSAQDLIDFTPIHRCCQIFNVIVSIAFLHMKCTHNLSSHAYL